ncbi:MAG: hypothetical protein NTZ17_02240 [Phycisphaerae bacterium]|nr:hypothetical protein [Phycisphaerae bacterium]
MLENKAEPVRGVPDIRAADDKNVEINGEYAYLNFPADWPKERIKEVYEKAQAERLHHGGTEGTETTNEK